MAMHAAVLRHAERADAVLGSQWLSSQDFQRWPLDPPLSDAGRQDARSVALELGIRGLGLRGLDFLATAKYTAPVTVVTSPFLRCVQTALECVEIHGGRLIIDLALGEVFGPGCMGEIEPKASHRPFDELRSYCEARNVEVHPMPIGESPSWPESEEHAKLRIRRRFWGHLQKSMLEQSGLLLVTHAVGVAASLVGLTVGRGLLLNRVPYCGFFLLRFEMNENLNEDVENEPSEELTAIESCWTLSTWNLPFAGRPKRLVEGSRVYAPARLPGRLPGAARLPQLPKAKDDSQNFTGNDAWIPSEPCPMPDAERPPLGLQSDTLLPISSSSLLKRRVSSVSAPDVGLKKKTAGFASEENTFRLAIRLYGVI
mmetsp:Transcript_6234/g.13799  ORF Transcript_6234/g.13799 Transcript_6234/m.13799 type:complete len:370 (+) Transcript_6234:108-1217(+)